MGKGTTSTGDYKREFSPFGMKPTGVGKDFNADRDWSTERERRIR